MKGEVNMDEWLKDQYRKRLGPEPWKLGQIKELQDECWKIGRHDYDALTERCVRCGHLRQQDG